MAALTINTDELLALERAAQRLMKEGKGLESLRYRERALQARRVIFGRHSTQLEFASEELALLFNTFGMRLVCEGRSKEALALLQKAEIITEVQGPISNRLSRLKLRAVTLNNIGCFYKNEGKLFTSLEFLRRALNIEASLPSCDNPASTHLNLCAVLSQLGRHREAVEHAQCALELLHLHRQRQRRRPSITEQELIALQPQYKDRNSDTSENSPRWQQYKYSDEDAGSPGDSGGGVRDAFPVEIRQEEIAERKSKEDGDCGMNKRASVSKTSEDEESALVGSPSSQALSLSAEVARLQLEAASSAPATGSKPLAAEAITGAAGSTSSHTVDRGPAVATSLLAIAYYNLGVEQEYLRDIAAAVESYRAAATVAAAELGASHPLAVGMRRSEDAAVAAKEAEIKAMMATGRRRGRPFPQASGSKDPATVDQAAPGGIGHQLLIDEPGEVDFWGRPSSTISSRRSVPAAPPHSPRSPRSLASDQ